MAGEALEKLVCVGVIASAHGVRGEVNIVPYVADPAFFTSHTSYSSQNGDRKFSLRVRGKKQRMLIASVDGITDRTMAESLKGTLLYVPRSLFPEPEEEEFYYDDLVGLRVEIPGQPAYGKVVGIYNFGAGEVVEVAVSATDKQMLYPFTKEVVPEIHLEAGYIKLVPPEVVNAKEEKPGGEE